MIKFISFTFLLFSLLAMPVMESSHKGLEQVFVSETNVAKTELSEEEKLVIESLKLDFTENIELEEEKISAYSSKTTKINYQEIKKQIKLKPIAITVKKESTTLTNITDIDLGELSYNHIKENHITTTKIDVIANLDFNFNLKKYDTIISEDRISTALAANEKSNKKPVENNKNENFETTHDELVFCNYTEDGKVNVAEPTVVKKDSNSKLADKLKVVATATHPVQKILPLLNDKKIMDLVKNKVSKSDIDYSKNRAQPRDLRIPPSKDGAYSVSYTHLTLPTTPYV